MLDQLADMNPANLAGAALAWFLGIVFLAMYAVAICRYLKTGR